MTTPTLTCEHCEDPIDVAADPHCIQQGGMDVMCEGCRERAWHQCQVGPRKLSDIVEPIIEAYRIKRGWQA